jgi:prepilin-type N-terminal cleavage/methylation domain-containing protein
METLSSRRRRGFTLVELLVVIVIISILAGLLLPVLGKATNDTHKAACASQLSQLYKLAVSYSVSHQGRWPSAKGEGLWTSFRTQNPPLLGGDHVKVLFCPVKGVPDVLEGCDYRGPLGSVGRLKPWEPVGADRPGNHGEDEGGSVLRMDGSVQACGPDDALWQDCLHKLSP